MCGCRRRSKRFRTTYITIFMFSVFVYLVPTMLSLFSHDFAYPLCTSFPYIRNMKKNC